ncbi:N-terminal phage integrase SAM-like domain-containing protein [Kitasatospora purpeofusca]|uniref:N-terminal phage integrase SAM-like domain-containing protein n=1 Tax=Kitasatospora purpeofusca TaxID=67352 RepID=UPI002A59F8F8|nr:N-terminal phage integrase SAM-like domain-containing protein [Kitasatospora purpeofusca]MDY0810577.1 N-terminal phage integrase SAM-like domain-containing protein [Kitasatospora purpeofusca]
MASVLDGELRGVYENRRTSVTSYLREWLATRKPHLAPNTYAGYAVCVERGLVPAFGHLRLFDLRPEHIDDWVTTQLGAERGRVAPARVRRGFRNIRPTAARLSHNPSAPAVKGCASSAGERVC